MDTATRPGMGPTKTSARDDAGSAAARVAQARARGQARRRRPIHLSGPDAARIAEVAGAVGDPELPFISLANLGVLRTVDVTEGRITVTLTPTYSGCPAMRVMAADVVAALTDAGYGDVTVRTVLADAWSSDDITDEGRESLARNGIAPPAHRADDMAAQPVVACPLCGSHDTQQLSRFGSTSCKALYRCKACAEPFDYFKVL